MISITKISLRLDLLSSPKLSLMFKIENDAWIKKLKETCSDDDHKFKEVL